MEMDWTRGSKADDTGNYLHKYCCEVHQRKAQRLEGSVNVVHIGRKESVVVIGFTWEIQQHICRRWQPLERKKRMTQNRVEATLRAKEKCKATGKANQVGATNELFGPPKRQLGSFPLGRRVRKGRYQQR